jgi:hypothetical protein
VFLKEPKSDLIPTVLSSFHEEEDLITKRQREIVYAVVAVVKVIVEE